MDTVQGFDCLVTQNVTLDTTSNAAANTIAESVNDEEVTSKRTYLSIFIIH